MIYCDIEDFDSQIEGRIITASEQFERMWGQRQYTIRDLYDFFDENNLIVVITCEMDYGYEILIHRYDLIDQVKRWYDTRIEAETEAFTKAFEIMELKKN